MGCSSSVISKNMAEIGGKDGDSICIPLSSQQKLLVRNTWEDIEPFRTAIGKQIHIRFFQVNPEYQKLFPEFRNIRLEDIGKTSGLLGHPKRVTKSLENAVSALKDAEIFTAYMEELGRRHQDRGLKPCHLDAMHAAVLWTLEEHLKAQWTPQVSEAWSELFRYITDTMKRGLLS